MNAPHIPAGRHVIIGNGSIKFSYCADKIRYTKKQQFLSDFFELLLTTGLKQEVGQFFTPVPIAKFIIRSIPFDKIIKEKLSQI